MNKSKVVIWGASGHALVVADILEYYSEYELVGFLDDVNPPRNGYTIEGKQVYYGIDKVGFLNEHGVTHFALGFGHCAKRIEVAHKLRDMKIDILTLIHPTAVISRSAHVGEGAVVGSGAIIDPSCHIGRYCIINNGAIISHNCQIEDGVHICPGALIGGWVTIGQSSWLGIGSVCKDRISIGHNTFIGAGSVVVKDIPDSVMAHGNPARIIRSIDSQF